MASLITREMTGVNVTPKGSELTWAEVDNDFIALNVDIAVLQSYYTTGVLKIANGGTGAATAPLARVSLGLTTATTGSMILPKGTTGERDANNAGYIRFNTSTSEFEGNNGSAWASVGGGAITNDTTTATNIYPLCVAATTGTALNVYTSNAKYLYKPSTGELTVPLVIASRCMVLNNTTISENYTVAAGTNAMSVGPITISAGVAATGQTGAKTIDKTTGTVNFAALATSLVVTNALVTANSIVICTVATVDATMKSVVAVATTGSFTLTANAGATAETRVNFVVFN